MTRLSMLLNVGIFVFSIPLFAGGIWLSTRATTSCETFLQAPLIALGVSLMMISLVGLLIAYHEKSLLLLRWIHISLFFILAIVFCFTTFTFVVTATTAKGTGAVVPQSNYQEHGVTDFSNWLQRRVEDSTNWAKIRSCLVRHKLCQRLQKTNLTFGQLLTTTTISPPEAGCCIPPTECEFIYQNATNWMKPSWFTVSSDLDCNAWENHQDQLCYRCRSCKAGVLVKVRDDWNKTAIISVVFLILLCILNSVGFWAARRGS